MSYRALNWAWEADLPMAQKFVLVALADMADEQETCFPGQERLGRMIGATDRTVRAALVKLEDAGLISRTQRRGSDGMRTSDRYSLHVNRKILPVVGSPEDYDNLTGNLRQPHRKHVPGNPQRTTSEPPDVLSTDESDDLGTLIPDVWRPTQRHIDKAASLRMDVKQEYQRFRAHAERNHRRQKNWNAAFTNWLQKGAVMAQQQSGRPVQTFGQRREENSLAIFEHYKNQEKSNAEVGRGEAVDFQALDRGR